MSDALAPRTGLPAKPARRRPDQLTVLGFVTDGNSETVLRDGLNDLAQNGIANTADIRRGTIKTAITAMMRLPAPQILVIDIAGDDQPLQSLAALCDVIEPSISVLVLGEIDDVELYRAINRQIGAVDYIFKPITREMVARYFASLITNDSHIVDATRGGRVVAITGARGGVGASTVACALAWFLGVDSNRHTLLLDANPFIGVALDRFGVEPRRSFGDLLTEADGTPTELFLDAAVPVQNRLAVLGGQPRLASELDAPVGAARRIIDAVRFRYNFVVVDLPVLPLQSQRELLALTHHRVVVLDPSVAGLRDTLRLLAIPNNPGQPQRPTILLNQEGRAGGLKRKHIEEALKRRVDIAVPHQPKLWGTTTPIGKLIAGNKAPLARMVHDLSREIGFESGRKIEKA
ncbi:histidine kinase [Acidiphilium sp. PA]|uniref:AAA family ATPase n=1 Tax=Acidiphilium sp. PA TaxID=2871705 RepID=UPI0022447177|nr:cellulose synthase operon protein YhjQ/BcsQ [Acidiphilium sp. PA]MCW8306379.1 histidine kinase [Acidiphilium sp. PA]